MKKTQKLKNIVTSCLESTTGHGLPNIIRTEHIGLKVFWLIAWLVGLGLTLYLLITSILAYFDYGVVSQIQIINERPMLFPEVTICNLDPFVTNDSITFLAQTIRNAPEYSQTVVSSGKTLDLDLVNYFILNIPGFEAKALYEAQKANLSRKISLGHDFNTLIQKCVFNDRACSADDFVHHYHLRLGSCYTFNSNTDSIKKSFTPGLFCILLNIFRFI